MSERFNIAYGGNVITDEDGRDLNLSVKWCVEELVDLLNEQQELIEELQVSDEMGWKRAEHFEKKCPKELHNKKMYIKRLEYKVQKFKEENDQLRTDNKQLKDDAKVVLLILQAIGELPFKISVSEAKAIKRLSENVGELFDGDVYAMDIEQLQEENDKIIQKNCIPCELVNLQTREIDKLKEENEQLRQKIKHCVYVDVDNENGCMNCKYDKGSICSILNCGTHNYLEGVSECGLKYWECKEDE